MVSETVNLAQLRALSDSRGIFESTLATRPRKDLGYRVDDVALALVLLERAGPVTHEYADLAATCRDFLGDAQNYDGRFSARCDSTGRWQGRPDVGDHWGRALWAFGTLVRHNRSDDVRFEALHHFERSAHLRPSSLKTMMFAALGAAEVLHALPHHVQAARLLRDAAWMVSPITDPEWPWPEEHICPEAGVVPQALMLAGRYLGDPYLIHDGLARLTWLRDVHGWDRGDAMESAAMVEACATAYEATMDRHWLTTMVDVPIEPNGQTESTIACLLVAQRRAQYEAELLTAQQGEINV